MSVAAQATASPRPLAVHGAATYSKIQPQAHTVLLNETFTTASAPTGWSSGGSACLTDGNASTPTAIPACGTTAPFDPPGAGVLDLTVPVDYTQGYAIWETPFATSAGLIVTFNYFSYDSSNVTGDGLALVFADASLPHGNIGGCCGSLDYAPASSVPFQPGLSDGYLAVGIDENGFWTCACYGKTGGPSYAVPNILTVRGSYATNWTYLLSSSLSGRPAQLPFPVSADRSTTRPRALTFTVSLTAAGVLSVSIDRNNGAGPFAYIPPTKIAGLFKEPAVPASVFLGFLSSQGASNARHEISDVTVTTMN